MSDSAIQVFQFESQEVRTTVDAEGDPWWVAADVCRILKIKNPTDAVARLDDDFKRLSGEGGLDSNEGNRRTVGFNLVNEFGLYTLILSSRKPEAKRFQRWLVTEVIPSIRKTGRYALPQADELPPVTEDERFRLAIRLMGALATAQAHASANLLNIEASLLLAKDRALNEMEALEEQIIAFSGRPELAKIKMVKMAMTGGLGRTSHR